VHYRLASSFHFKIWWTGLFIIPWHISQNWYTWMAKRTLTCDLQTERETSQVFLIPYKCATCLPIVTGRCQADKLFSPAPVAACHNWFLRRLRWFIFAAQAGPAVDVVERQHP
jgi:hypothetical protein